MRATDTDKEQIEKPEKSENKNGRDTKSSDFEEKKRDMDEILRQSPESNEFYLFEEINVEKIQNLGAACADNKTSPVKIFIRAPTDEESSTIDENHSKSTQNVQLNDDFNPGHPDNAIFEQETALKLSIEDINEIDSESIDNEKKSLTTQGKGIEIIENLTTPTSSSVEFILEHEKPAENIDLEFPTILKITESFDDFTKVESGNSVQNITNDEGITDKQNTSVRQFEVRTIPLKFESPKLRKKNFDEDNTKNQTPTPPQRRRSVKEIIESINKCQSLLKVNRERQSFKNNVNDSGEKQYQSKMFSDIAEVNNNIPLVLEKFNVCNNDNKHVEWNPVPKPRRHHKYPKQGSIN